MEIQKLVAASFTGKGVTGLPDTPNLSASEMQAKFDELSKDVLAPKINEVIDGLIAEEKATQDYYEQATALTQAHMENKENPHRVTAEQTGAATPAFVLNAIASAGGGGTGMPDHTVLIGREKPDQHPIGAITGLAQAVKQLESMQSSLGTPNGIATLDGSGKLKQMPTAADVGVPVETGTWTPELTSYSGSTQPTVTYETPPIGYYWQIGNIVMATCRIQGRIISAGDGFAQLGGLPLATSFNIRYFPVIVGELALLLNAAGVAHLDPSNMAIKFRNGLTGQAASVFEVTSGNYNFSVNLTAIYPLA